MIINKDEVLKLMITSDADALPHIVSRYCDHISSLMWLCLCAIFAALVICRHVIYTSRKNKLENKQ